MLMVIYSDCNLGDSGGLLGRCNSGVFSCTNAESEDSDSENENINTRSDTPSKCIRGGSGAGTPIKFVMLSQESTINVGVQSPMKDILSSIVSPHLHSYSNQ